MKLNILIIKTSIKVKQFEILKTFSTLSHLQLEVKLLKFKNVSTLSRLQLEVKLLPLNSIALE